MRQYPPQYAAADAAAEKSPRFVVAILFDVASLYFTSHDDIPNVPGVVIEGVLEGVSATSQKINPDQARAEIGSMSFSLVDIDHQVRDAFRQKEVVDEKGLRGKTVRLYRGYAGFDFSAFVLFQTQQIEEIEYNEGTYHVSCRDIQRAQRKDIFEPVTTTLRLPVSESDTTIPVYDTSKFIAVAHGSSFSDGPNITCGYIKIDDEIIRWTGKTADSFTGCTRGVLNTRAVAHTVDAAASAERRSKVEEVIYLEMPAVKLAYAILTGRIHNSPNTLPDHWHLGIDPAEWIRESDFTENFPDVWNPANDSDGLILRFVGLKKTDGKAFLEKEIYLLLGAFSPIYSDGRLGLKRRVSLVGDSAPVAVLTERDIVSHSGLTHDMGSMHNVFRVEWNHNGKEFTRIHQFADAYSYDIHGKSDLKTLQFRGLYGSRATDATIWQILNFLRDGYSSPPLRLKVDLLPSLSQFEVGDCVRVTVENLQDYTGTAQKIDRAFEVQRVTLDHVEGDVSLELFGSTSRPVPDAPAPTPAPVPDAWYTSQGTPLSSVVTIVGGVVQPGTYNFNGGANLNAPAAILYYDGDLTWQQGATLNLTGNLQLRVKGFLTFNGRINGKGGGLPGVAPNSNPLDPQIGNPGFVGSSRGRDGFNIFQQGGNPVMQSTPVPTTHGKYSAFPLLDVRVENDAVVGIPNDLRGTGGGPGGKVVYQTTTLRASGGAGGNGGAGLAIICRGIAFGASASIDLSGNDTSAPAPFIDSIRVWYPGAGGAGGPGALLILLDGTHHSIPDITGRFIGRIGRVGNPNDRVSTDFPGVEEVHFMESRSTGRHSKREGPYAGYEGPEILSELDLSNAAHRIQKIPPPQTPQEDIEAPPAAPTALTVVPGVGFMAVSAVWQTVSPFDWLEVWASLDNNRQNAVLVGRARAAQIVHGDLPVLATRYYWARVVRDFPDRPDVFSDWFPLSATGGISATTLNPAGWTPVVTNGGGATMIVTASTIEKSGGVNAFDSSVHSIEGYHNGSFVSARMAHTNKAIAFGLTSDPAASADQNSIDYAWRANSDGTLDICENGSVVVANVAGGYDTSTVLMIRHDGATVRYYRNGVLVRSTPATDQTLCFDSSFGSPGGKLVDVKFGPQGSKGDQGPQGEPGTNGLSIAELQIFRRSSTAPSTPTGGSYDFGAQALTPPAGWSSTIPAGNDPIYASRAVAAVQGTSGTDSTLTWSAPVLLTQEGSAVDIIFRRAVNQPATPPPSSGVPTGWYSDVNSVPAGQGVLWSSVGTRANAGQNWTWQTPIAIEGDRDQRNLLRVDVWTAGALSNQIGNWALNQSTSGENQIINGVGPYGASQLLWECRCMDPGFGNGGEGNGGWNNTGDLIGRIDHTKTYRSTVWLRRRVSGTNQFYHGCDRDGGTVNLDGSANSNPYFVGGVSLSSLSIDKWYLSVGIIHGSGHDSSSSDLSGIWDPETGTRVIAGTDFKMAPGATRQTHRVYMYYGGDTSTRLDLADPRFEAMDGNEPSILALLGKVGTGMIVPGAVSLLGSAYSAAIDSRQHVSGNPELSVDVLSVNVETTGFPVAIDAYATMIVVGTAPSYDVLEVRVYRDGAPTSSAKWDASFLGLPVGYTAPLMLSLTDMPPKGAHTYSIHFRAFTPGPTGSFGIVFIDKFIKVREYRR